MPVVARESDMGRILFGDGRDPQQKRSPMIEKIIACADQRAFPRIRQN